MKHVIVSAFLLFLLNACGGNSTAPSVNNDPTVVPISFSSGAGDLGVFDPSVTRDPVSGRLWMSYSSVAPSSYWDSSVYWGVSIRLAYSDDDGISWQDQGEAVANMEATVGPMNKNPSPETIPANSKGIWQSETSSLIYDPLAIPAERWKLIWHQYLNADLTPYFADYGWFALKMAATPEGLTTASPIKLFGGIGLQADGSNTGSPVYSPTGGAPAIRLNSDLSQKVGGAATTELNTCVFAEPGLYATDSAVYLATFCADVSSIVATGSPTQYLVSFRCGSPCDMTSASSWEYLGRLLTPADALAATADHHFQAPTLVNKNGKTYLIVTPVDTTSGERYDGCRVYQFTDIDSNQLLRDTNTNELVEITRVEGDPGTHNGACTALDGMDGGIQLSQFEAGSTDGPFKIYKTQVSLP